MEVKLPVIARCYGIPVYWDEKVHGRGTVCGTCGTVRPKSWRNPLLVELKRRRKWKGDIHGGMVLCDACAHRTAVVDAAKDAEACVVATGVPREFRDATWDGFDSRGGALDETLATLQWFMATASDEWLYLFGPVGSGKTRAAATIVLEWMRHRSTYARFLTAAQLFSGLRESEFGRGSGGLDIDLVAGYHLLVVDDLGAEKATDYRTEKLIEVMAARWDHDPQHHTVITSNLDLEQLSVHLGSERLSSRLAQWCRFVRMDASDYRVEIARGRRSQLDG